MISHDEILILHCDVCGKLTTTYDHYIKKPICSLECRNDKLKTKIQKPMVINMEKEVSTNEDYRKIVFTGHLQLVYMTLLPNGFIEKELHQTDQFIRIEKGNARITLYDIEGDNIIQIIHLEQGTNDTILIPSNNWHMVENYSNVSKLRLYTIYTPPTH